MKWRKILAAGMGLVLAAGLMSGCGDQKKETGSGKKDDQEKAMGRYVEEDLKPPVQDGETPLGAYKKDGILHLYTSGASQDSGTKYYSYQYQDGQWSEAQEDAGLTAMGSDFMLNHLEYGEDGNVYAMGTPTNPTDAMPYGWHIFKNTQDSDTWEDVTPENLTKADENGYAANVTDVDALADGSLCVANGSTGQAEIYKDGEKVFSADMEPMMSNFQNTIGTSQNRLAVTAKDGKSITFYNTDDYSETGSAALTKKGESFKDRKSVV